MCTVTIIPAPQEMRVTGGEYRATKPPKSEKVYGIPPEGYELSITTNGITIRHSDDAGLFYAKVTLEQLMKGTEGAGAGAANAGYEIVRCPTSTRHDLEWKMWPRTFAVAEILWTYPDPAKRDFAEFSARAAEHRRRLIGAHVNCAPLK